MGLREAVLEIAEQLDKECDQPDAITSMVNAQVLRGYARQLRSVVKASEGVANTINPREVAGLVEYPLKDFETGPLGAVILQAHGLDPSGPEKAKQKRLERAAEREDSGGLRMVELLDGTNDGVCEMVPIPMNMQPGMATDIGRRVFVLKRLDNGTHQLHLHEAETARRFPPLIK